MLGVSSNIQCVIFTGLLIAFCVKNVVSIVYGATVANLGKAKKLAD